MSPSGAGRQPPGADLAAARLADLGREFWRRGWALATSGNFSAVLSRDPLALLITPSGADKGSLAPEHLLVIDGSGAVLRGNGRPSDETALHLAVVSRRAAGAVLHTHSVWSALLSEKHGDAGHAILPEHEMLKGLTGVTSHRHRERVPIIENSQDDEDLTGRLIDCLESYPDAHGVLVRGHGLTTWGRDIDEARRHIEAYEFLFELAGRAGA